jgi:hypothetical protein
MRLEEHLRPAMYIVGGTASVFGAACLAAKAGEFALQAFSRLTVPEMREPYLFAAAGAMIFAVCLGTLFAQCALGFLEHQKNAHLGHRHVAQLHNAPN